MVQNFAVFTDRSASMEIQSMTLAKSYYGLLVGVVSPECQHKI